MSYPAQLMIITGMSGAGRSTAAKALEDLGWYVIDNLPPQLLADVTTLISSGHSDANVAVVVDARSRHFFADLRGILDQLRSTGLRLQILFLDARDDVLVRRQDAARRPHPLQSQGRLLDGIRLERQLIRELRGDADIIIDTSEINVHQLADRVTKSFGDADETILHATVVSFGFKYGIPADADMVIDIRFLPNPHWDPVLRPQTGLDDPVRDSVLGQLRAERFLGQLDQLLETVFDGFADEHKQLFCLAVGCTGGKHRSVTMAEEVARRLREHKIETLVVHRDLGRE
jgi:RNase adapter protein RapZ